jgi:hypothetical protein
VLDGDLLVRPELVAGGLDQVVGALVAERVCAVPERDVD